MIELSSVYDGGPLLVYFPNADGPNFLRIEQGTGDNLLWEDRRDGYVDYLNLETYSLSIDSPPEFIESDGGQVNSREYFSDKTIGEVIRASSEQFDLQDEEFVIISGF